MARTKQIVIGALVLVVLGVAAFYSNYEVGKKQDADQKVDQLAVQPEPGYRAPDFTLPTLADPNKMVKLSDLQGKPVLLNFWASWCTPCKQEMPDLQQVYERNKDKVTFYTINLTEQDEVQKADAFLKQYGITIPGLLDPQSQGMKLYKVISVPTTYAIDANGFVAEKRPGAMSAAAMQGIIDRLLAKQKEQAQPKSQ